MVAVTARLNNRDLGSTLTEIQKNITTKINLPRGYQIEYGGSYAGQQQAFKELLTILLLAVLLVFTVILFLIKKSENWFCNNISCCFGNERKCACIIYNGHSFKCWKLHRPNYDNWNHW